MLDELTIIDRYFRPLAGEGGLGLLDDAAKLAPPPGFDLVVTCDMLAAGVHFLDNDPPSTIARKALRVNLSDLAAKGAEPFAYVLGAGLPTVLEESWIAGFTEGLRQDQNAFGVALIGGDTITVASGPVLSITAFGRVPHGQMVHRFGGRPGDSLYVTGSIGGAAAGLSTLRGEAAPWHALSNEQRDVLVARYRIPEPRVSLAPALREFASAAMDISDGLVGDCDKLARASRCSALISADSVPLAVPTVGTFEPALIARLLTAGDDYEILAAVPAAAEARFIEAARTAGTPVARIGILREGNSATEVLLNGEPLHIEHRSYIHGRG